MHDDQRDHENSIAVVGMEASFVPQDLGSLMLFGIGPGVMIGMAVVGVVVGVASPSVGVLAALPVHLWPPARSDSSCVRSDPSTEAEPDGVEGRGQTPTTVQDKDEETT